MLPLDKVLHHFYTLTGNAEPLYPLQNYHFAKHLQIPFLSSIVALGLCLNMNELFHYKIPLPHKHEYSRYFHSKLLRNAPPCYPPYPYYPCPSKNRYILSSLNYLTKHWLSYSLSHKSRFYSHIHR